MLLRFPQTTFVLISFPFLSKHWITFTSLCFIVFIVKERQWSLEVALSCYYEWRSDPSCHYDVAMYKFTLSSAALGHLSLIFSIPSHSFGLSLASTFLSIMAYEPINFYIPLDPATKSSTVLFYPPQSLLPGEAASSVYYSYGPSDIPGSEQAPKLTHPGPLTPRRRSSYSNNSYPYPTSHYDTPRSPTRTRFNLHDPNIPSSENVFYSPTRSRFPSNNSDFLGPERHNKSYRRPHEDCVPQTPRKPYNVPAIPIGPTNHILIPQTPFEELVSSRSHHYRYPDITFHVARFPEMGVKVGALNRTKIPLLSGAEDLVLQDVQEREIKIRILWPGYSAVSFEKRLKTLHGSTARTRISVAIKLAQIILEFANHLRLTRAQVELGQEQWMIDSSGTLGISCSDVFITRLIHCGGSHWQIELWAPKEMMSKD